MVLAVLRIRIRDPGSGAFLTLGSGMGKISGSGSGMKNPDYISESLESIFWVKKCLNSLMRIRHPISGMEKIWIRDGKNSDQGWKKFGSGMENIRIRDPG